jgi:hypothetical protein
MRFAFMMITIIHYHETFKFSLWQTEKEGNLGNRDSGQQTKTKLKTLLENLG